MMQNHEVKIITHVYECGDGCCHDDWDEVLVDGEYLSTPNALDPRYPSILRFHNDEDIFVAVAKKLGITLHVERLEAYSE